MFMGHTMRERECVCVCVTSRHMDKPMEELVAFCLSTAESPYPVASPGPTSSWCCSLPNQGSGSWALKVPEWVRLGRGLQVLSQGHTLIAQSPWGPTPPGFSCLRPCPDPGDRGVLQQEGAEPAVAIGLSCLGIPGSGDRARPCLL